MSDPKVTALEGEGTALETANAVERRIQLEGRKDPEKFKMPDGRTLAETRKELYESHVKEGDEAAKVQLKRVREQSIEGDPLYAEGAKAVMVGNNATVLPAKSESAESRPQQGGDLNAFNTETETETRSGFESGTLG